MAEAYPLTAADAQRITAQAAPLLKHLRKNANPQAYALYETFDVLVVHDVPKDDSSAALADVAEETGLLHHQIRNRATRHHLYARTERDRDGSPTLVALFESRIAAAIDAAIDDVDAEWGDDPAGVSLVVFPRFHTSALWVRSATRSALYVVAHPGAMKFRRHTGYHETVFLRTLTGLATHSKRPKPQRGD